MINRELPDIAIPHTETDEHRAAKKLNGDDIPQDTERATGRVKDLNLHYPFLHFLSLSGLQGIQPRQIAKRIAHPDREPMKTTAPESQETSQVKILQNMTKPLLKV